MKNHVSKVIVLICGMLCTTLVFASEPNVTLTFETKNSKGETATLYQLPALGQWIEVGKAKPDENGLLTFALTLTKPERLVIVYKDMASSNLLIKPDKNYRFYVDYNDIKRDITNENQDDMINLFLGKWTEARNKIDDRNKNDHNGKELYDLKAEEQVAAFNDREKQAKVFLTDFVKKYEPNADDYYFMENVLHNELLGLRFNNRMGSGYENLKDMVESQELNVLFNSIRLDPKFLKVSPTDNAMPLFYYIVFSGTKSFVEKNNALQHEDISKQDYTNFIREIPNLSVPAEIKEYLLAYQIHYSVKDKEMYNELMPVLQTKYPESEYTSIIKTAFAKAHNLDGNPAPDIKGITVSGDTVSLTSLKGKVVYIDFWATWCGPCREEFPKSIELKKQFEGRNDIVFMYVSVDEETDKWQKYVEEHPELKGLHITGKGDYREGFGKAYGIGGIPHYVLINKEGIVVESNAPRPSDDRTADLINEQL